LKPKIAKRAYELYEQRGHKDGKAIQDWRQAEEEIRKNEDKDESKPEDKDKKKPEPSE
jgi:hypothetical protein